MKNCRRAPLPLTFVTGALLVACGGAPSDSAELSEDTASVTVRDRFAAWFADYNEGQGTAYLDTPYRVRRRGDSRYPDAPAHAHHRSMQYGPFPRNVLDVWSLNSDAPTPLAIFIHGGGFNDNDKESIHRSRTNILRLLEAGVSVASISYRIAYRDPDAALEAPIPNDIGEVHDENGTRVDYILRDCARAVQFLRHRADLLNIDPSRIGAWGPSAGAGCTVWVGTVPNLAVSGHSDPVLRQSTRIAVMGHENGQPTYDWGRWPELLDMSEDFVFDTIGREPVRLLQMEMDDFRFTRAGRDLAYILDYYRHLGRNDPPLFTVNGGRDVDEPNASASQIIHHPRAHVALYDKCVASGGTCEIDTVIESTDYPGTTVHFLAEQLLAP
ncbi:MAG: alpha/beta hydrolase [Deltaproteobacteria bacterium]|jgi:acetyl esterase/lipase